MFTFRQSINRFGIARNMRMAFRVAKATKLLLRVSLSVVTTACFWHVLQLLSLNRSLRQSSLLTTLNNRDTQSNTYHWPVTHDSIPGDLPPSVILCLRNI